MKTPFSLASKYNTLAALLGGLVLGTILINVILIGPAGKSLKETNQKLPEARAQNAQAVADLKALEGIKNFFNDRGRREEVARVSTAVPIQAEVPSILALLESLSKAKNVQLTSFSPQQVSPTAATAPTPGAANSIEITANYKGEYTNLIAFFFELENSLRIVDVKSLGVQSSRDNAIEGALTFRAYYKPIPGVADTGTVTPTAGGR